MSWTMYTTIDESRTRIYILYLYSEFDTGRIKFITKGKKNYEDNEMISMIISNDPKMNVTQ